MVVFLRNKPFGALNSCLKCSRVLHERETACCRTWYDSQCAKGKGVERLLPVTICIHRSWYFRVPRGRLSRGKQRHKRMWRAPTVCQRDPVGFPGPWQPTALMARATRALPHPVKSYAASSAAWIWMNLWFQAGDGEAAVWVADTELLENTADIQIGSLDLLPKFLFNMNLIIKQVF